MRFAEFLPLAAGLALALAVASVAGAAAGPTVQAADTHKAPGQRTVPLYAENKDGSPAAALTAADLEVFLGGRPAENFSLTRGGASHKLVFLVFDTATVGSSLLSKAKKIAEETINRADGRVRFALMSIDPGSGLRLVAGPSADKDVLLKAMAKSVVSRQSDYFRSRSTSGTGIRDAYPQYHDISPAKFSQEEKKRDQQQDRQVGSVIIASFRTLNAILGRFPESDKVVHLFSCGIPLGGTVNTAKVIYDTGGNTAGADNVDISSPDSAILDQIKSAGRGIKENGGLLFLINPGGLRAGQDDAASGEQSLHMLANDSAGRYLEGADKDISRALAAVEQGYYQLSLPELPDMPMAGAALEVRLKNPAIALTTVPSLPPARRFARLSPDERQAVVLSVLTDGLVGDIDLQVGRTDVGIQGSDGEVLITAQLPLELSQAEWDIYKVWRDRTEGGVTVEREHVLSSGPLLSFTMAVRENEVQDAVLVHARSGTVLVCRTSDQSKN